MYSDRTVSTSLDTGSRPQQTNLLMIYLDGWVTLSRQFSVGVVINLTSETFLTRAVSIIE